MLNMAKPSTSPELRLSGGSAQNEAPHFASASFRFASFRRRRALGRRWRRTSTAAGSLDPNALPARTPCRSLCDRMSLVGVRTSF